jgi:hypothetical protein
MCLLFNIRHLNNAVHLAPQAFHFSLRLAFFVGHSSLAGLLLPGISDRLRWDWGRLRRGLGALVGFSLFPFAAPVC